MSENIRPFTDKRAAILNYEPIELNGLVCYPIKVADYGKWQVVKPVLILRQGTLPAAYACMNFLQCIWAMQYDAYCNGDTSNGPWDLLAGLMFLSLRLSDTDIIRPIGNPDDPRIVTAMRIIKGGETHDISVMDFPQFRRIIAEQNGAELPDEADNPDLVEAAEDMADSSNVGLKYDFSDMLTSVATALNLRRCDLMDWTVKEFDDVTRAIRRRYGHFLSFIAESQGAKFSHGNPYPTWLFDREKDEFAGLISLEKLQNDHNANIAVSEDAPSQPQFQHP